MNKSNQQDIILKEFLKELYNNELNAAKKVHPSDAQAIINKLQDLHIINSSNKSKAQQALEDVIADKSLDKATNAAKKTAEENFIQKAIQLASEDAGGMFPIKSVYKNIPSEFQSKLREKLKTVDANKYKELTGSTRSTPAYDPCALPSYSTRTPC